MKIPVKMGLELLVILFIPSFIIVRAAIWRPELETISLAIVFVSIIGIAILSVRYKINEDVLEITNCILWKTKIYIQEISKIEKTWNAISGPAQSMFGRVEIYYSGKSVVISPQNFKEFSEAVLNINPEIIVKQ